jgi:predicted transcriptional regulator
MTTKEKIIGLVLDMPDGISMDKIVYNLHVLSEIEHGRADFKNGKFKSHDDVMKKYSKWLLK